MARKKEIIPKRSWKNIRHYVCDIDKAKNLNEIYRFVYYNPVGQQVGADKVYWVYLDVPIDLFIYPSEEKNFWKVQQRVASGFKYITRLRCTGIRDKFYNLIFEGDITECKLGPNNISTGCVIYSEQDGSYSKGYTSIGSYKKYTEIVGDIFTTPNLDWRKDEHRKLLGLSDGGGKC